MFQLKNLSLLVAVLEYFLCYFRFGYIRIKSSSFMEPRRRDGQSKKQFYRRMAESKKQQWMKEHRQQEDDFFKSHFCVQQEQQSSHDSSKSKKITKVQHKSQMRLRNRVAAQQSRQRHRYYVQELQRKVKQYEQLLQHQTLLCSNCKRSLQDIQQCQFIAQQSSVESSQDPESPCDGVSQEQFLNSLLQDQTIRIDNNGGATPFGIFFIVCIVAVLAIFSFNTNHDSMAPRLLTNYYSTLDNLLYNDEDLIHHNAIRQRRESSILLQSFIPTHQQNPKIRSIQDSLGNNQNDKTQQLIDKKWKQYGKYVCSQPEILLNKKMLKQKRQQQFLLLRTGLNSTNKDVKKQQTSSSIQTENQGYQILSSQWQKLEISSCYLGEVL